MLVERISGRVSPSSRILRSADFAGGGSAVIMPRHFSPTPVFPLKISRPDNIAAFQKLRDTWPLLPGTKNTLVIDDQTERLRKNPLKLAIFDWDETVSLIKCGWNVAMIKYISNLWANPDFVPPALAYYQDIDPTLADKSFAELFVRKTTGTLTPVQYAGAIHLKAFRVPSIGGIDPNVFDRAISAIFDQNEKIFLDPQEMQPWNAVRGKQLWELGNSMYDEWHEIMDAEFRQRRLGTLRDHSASPEEYYVADVIPFINGIRDRNATLYGLSGSEQSEVEEDAKALTAFHHFKIVFGLHGALEKLTQGRVPYSKTNGGNYILESEHVTNDARPSVAYVGDGPNEIKMGKNQNGTRIGIIPAHVANPIALANMLIEFGAQYLFLEGFTDWRVTVPYFFGEN